jgi:hypothetical protein
MQGFRWREKIPSQTLAGLRSRYETTSAFLGGSLRLLMPVRYRDDKAFPKKTA